MNQFKRVFIVGPSGAGKGVVAHEVARQLGWQFVNADILGCLSKVGREVKEVFGSKGELGFHQLLVEMLEYQQTLDHIVVTTDESIVCHERAREILTAEFTVHMTVSTETQVARMGDYRPLLPVENYAAILDGLHERQDAQFNQVASYTLNTDNGDIELDASNIVEAMKK